MLQHSGCFSEVLQYEMELDIKTALSSVLRSSRGEGFKTRPTYFLVVVLILVVVVVVEVVVEAIAVGRQCDS